MDSAELAQCERFRSGSCLNPELPEKYKKEWFRIGSEVRSWGMWSSIRVWETVFPFHRIVCVAYIIIIKAPQDFGQLSYSVLESDSWTWHPSKPLRTLLKCWFLGLNPVGPEWGQGICILKSVPSGFWCMRFSSPTLRDLERLWLKRIPIYMEIMYDHRWMPSQMHLFRRYG